jgi:hypothetical protein
MKIAILESSTGTVYIRDIGKTGYGESDEDIANEVMESLGVSASDSAWIMSEELIIDHDTK